MCGCNRVIFTPAFDCTCRCLNPFCCKPKRKPCNCGCSCGCGFGYDTCRKPHRDHCCREEKHDHCDKKPNFCGTSFERVGYSDCNDYEDGYEYDAR